MQKKFPEAEVFETKKMILKNPIIFAGFVGAGLVGPVAINHIIDRIRNGRNSSHEIKIPPTINSVHERQTTSSI